MYGLAATCYRLATGRVPVAAVERDGGAALPRPQQLNPAHLQVGQRRHPRRPRAGAGAPPPGPRRVPGPARHPLLARRTPVGPARAARRAEADDLATGADPERPDPGPARAWAPVVSCRPPSPAPLDQPAPAAAPDPRTVGPGARGPPRCLVPPVAPRPIRAGRWSPSWRRARALHRRPGFRRHRTARATGPSSTSRPGPHVRPRVAERMADPGPAVARSDAAPWTDGADGAGHLGTEPRQARPCPLAVLAVVAASAAPLIITRADGARDPPGSRNRRRRRGPTPTARRGFAGGGAERRLPAGAAGPGPIRSQRRPVDPAHLADHRRGGRLVGRPGTPSPRRRSPSACSTASCGSSGPGTMAAILLTDRDGSSRFRTGLGIEELADRVVPDGRTTERLVVGWIVMVVLVVVALWLDPAPFPLRVRERRRPTPAGSTRSPGPPTDRRGWPWGCRGSTRPPGCSPTTVVTHELEVRPRLLETAQRRGLCGVARHRGRLGRGPGARCWRWERDHRPGPGRRRRSTPSVHPLVAAGLRTQEDLVLMVPHDDGLPPRRGRPLLPVALAPGRQDRRERARHPRPGPALRRRPGGARSTASWIGSDPT